MYDITNYDSFEHLEEWHNEIQRHASSAIETLVIGNKADLTDDRQVSTAEGQQFVDALGSAPFLEVSAKNAVNVEAVRKKCIIPYPSRMGQIPPQYKAMITWKNCNLLKKRRRRTIVKYNDLKNVINH